MNERGSRAVLIHGGLVVIVALTLLIGIPSVTLLVGGLVMTPTYVALGLRESRRAPLWISPLSFYLLWYACGLGLSAIYIAWRVAGGEELAFSVAGVTAPNLATAYVVYLAGSVALHAGLQLGRPGGAATTSWRPRRRDTTMLVLHGVLWFAGLWLMWDFSWLVRLGAFARVFQWTALAATIAFALCRGFGVSVIEFRVLLALATLGLLGANLMSYSKAYIMYSFIPVIWLCLLERRARRWLPAVSVVLGILYLFVVSPVIMQARSQPLMETESPAGRLVTTFADFFDEHSNAMSKISLWDPIEALLMRQFDPVALGYIVGEVNTYGLQYGATMDYIAYAFIPRVLWPDKPAVTRGAWFNVYTGFAETEREATTSVGITATGELYWNYGVLGTLAGMLAIGWLLGRVWSVAGTDPRGDIVRMLLYVVLIFQMNNMSEFVSMLVSILVMFVLFGGLRLLSRVFARRDTMGSVAPA